MAEKSRSAEQQRELVKRSNSAFNKGNFGECTNLLNSVLSWQKHRDSTVYHNMVIAEFFNGGLRNIEGFKTKMKVICNMNEVKIEKATKPFDSAFYHGCYNTAVVNYHTKQYDDALSILNQLTTHIKFISRDLAEKIVLLLIQTYLVVCKPDVAFYIVTWVEGFYQTKSASASMSLFNDNGLENIKTAFQLRLLELKCKCILQLGGTCETELVVLEANCEKAFEKMGYESQECYNARCKNMKINARVMLAHSFYLKKNINRCVEILVSVIEPSNYHITSDSVNSILANNVACSHLWIKKPALASFYMRRAIDRFDEDCKEFPPSKLGSKDNKRPLFNFDFPYELLYNSGVALLYSNKPHEAFDCFTEVLQVYHMNPRLWFRLAECCIIAHKEGNDVDYDYQQKFQILRNIVGTDENRSLLLNLRLFENNKYSHDAQSFAIPIASLEFGTLCLRNVLLLLSNDNVDYSPSHITDVKKTNDTLRVQTLISSAYVGLCVGDPLICLQYTGYIFNSTANCPGIFRLLAHLYTAEAYMALNKLDDSLEHLQPDYCNYVGSRGKNDPFWNPLTPFNPETTKTVRITILYNMAVISILKHEFSRAHDILKDIITISESPGSRTPIHVLTLTIYLEIASGRNGVAINLIKQHCPQYFKKALTSQ